LNPSGKVPSLFIDNELLSQVKNKNKKKSIGILEYLEETRTTKNTPELLPKDHKKRAKVRTIVQIIASDTHPLQNLSVLNKVEKEMNGNRIEWGKYWIDSSFESLEKILEKCSGKYCVGDEVTFADLCLIPQIYNANRFGVDMSKYPIISKIDENCSLLEEFKNAHPDNQPDKL
jgi:maleylacetoacetate isomerase